MNCVVESPLLPIESILAPLQQALANQDVILVAPPGAGKSTCLPLHLLRLSEFQHQKIIMLQPRRIAVRSIAAYLAEQLSEPVGNTVGYRMRGENKVSANTRLEIVTEGILLRMLQSQPELAEVGLILFDEFHERSIYADFSLALCLEVQQALRDDLRLLVMSATLDIQALQPLLPEATLLQCEGRSYPVDIRYHPDTTTQPLSAKITRLVQLALQKHTGSLLVFLPGARDIRETEHALIPIVEANVQVHCLYGELSKQAQLQAISVCPPGQRKIVLATNIAETSLTIEGIEVVIDSGIEKTAQFQLTKGITQLVSQRISQSSATQRAGRAGRLAAGVCYRLWSREQQDRMAAQRQAEILSSDLSAFILEACVWGSDICQLALIDMPSNAQIQQANQLLIDLQALDAQGKLTAHGRALQQMGGHPSIANMLVNSQHISPAHQSLAAAIASLLEHKDPLKRSNTAQLQLRLQYCQHNKQHAIWQHIRHWHQRVGGKVQDWPLEDSALLLGYAYPQWIAKRRDNGGFLLANGSGARLHRDDPMAAQPWLVIGAMLSTDKQQGDVQITLAEPLSLAQLQQHFCHLIQTNFYCAWDQSKQAIVAQQRQMLGKIVLSSQSVNQIDQPHLDQIWQQVIQQKGIGNLPFNDATWQLIYRIRLAQQLIPAENWPDMSEQGLLDDLAQWLLPYLVNVMSWKQVSQLNFTDMLLNRLDWSLQQKLNRVFPTRYTVPSGSDIKLDYHPDGDVSLSVRMQELYGMQDTLTLANGELPVLIELLSPAHRPIQKTRDLASFWQGSYKEVQKEMKGRYPKHYWPDDPANALATTKTKKFM